MLLLLCIVEGLRGTEHSGALISDSTAPTDERNQRLEDGQSIVLLEIQACGSAKTSVRRFLPPHPRRFAMLVDQHLVNTYSIGSI